MSARPGSAAGQRLGYRADPATDAAAGPGLPDVTQLFTDRLDTIHSPRPALQELLHHARPGDTVVVASMEQLARSIADLRRVINGLVTLGAAVEFVQEQITFSPADGSAAPPSPIDVLDAIADFDRTRTRERQRAGIEAAKARGVYKGRAKKLDPEQVQQLLDQAAAGATKTSLARDFHLSRETVYEYLRRANQHGPGAN